MVAMIVSVMCDGKLPVVEGAGYPGIAAKLPPAAERFARQVPAAACSFPEVDRSTAITAGLCATCAHCRLVESRRSRFYLCERSRTDPAFPRYPRLPVVACRGYDEAQPAADGAERR
jgi:hypothetical protein